MANKTKSIRQWRKEFDQFLRDNGVASAFYVNRAIWVNLIGKDYPKYIMKYRKVLKSHWVSTAAASFFWKDTPEGYEFWCEIDNKWQHKLNTNV